jgi:hypothetical protein
MGIMIDAEFSVRDRVYIDGCTSIVGVVTAVTWRSAGVVNYEVSWFCDGESKHDIIEGWRLSRGEARGG